MGDGGVSVKSLGVSQPPGVHVLLACYHLSHVHRPFYGYVGVVIAYARLLLWGIGVVDLICEDGLVREDKETMGETAWDEELCLVLLAQLHHDVPSECL